MARKTHLGDRQAVDEGAKLVRGLTRYPRETIEMEIAVYGGQKWHRGAVEKDRDWW